MSIISDDVLIMSCVVDKLFSTFLSCCETGIVCEGWVSGTFALMALYSCPITSFFLLGKPGVAMEEEKKKKRKAKLFLSLLHCFSSYLWCMRGKNFRLKLRIPVCEMKRRLVRGRKVHVLLVHEMMDAKLVEKVDCMPI